MDANPAPGAIPAISGIDKVLPKTQPDASAETNDISSKDPASAKADEATAPKPASVEDVPDKDGPSATTGVDSAKPIPEASKPPAEGQSAAPQNGVASTGGEAVSATDAADGDDKVVIDKPAAVNGSNGSGPAEDVQMTGAIDGGAATDEAEAPAAAAAPLAESAPVAAGEREAAPQAIPADEKPEEGTESDKKRKADELEGGDDDAAAAADNVSAGDAEEAPKRKVGRPPSKANGDANGDEGLGHKLAKKAKKVLPVGKTERKTRSQGPA